METLKPCPFCGEPAHLTKTNLGWFAECSKYGHIHNAGVLGGNLQPTVRKAIKEWNTRKAGANND